MSFFHTIQIILIVVLGAAVLYILFFALAGLFFRQKPYVKPSRFRKIAVLIPGYKEDTVIVDVAKAALQQQYPLSMFEVVVVADSFQHATIDRLRQLPIKIIEVQFEKSTKSNALNAAMERLGDDYEIAVVLDADNMMEKHFLSKINAAFEADIIAVQGHRTAKNLNNNWAVLDAISEEINNHIFRKGHRAVGLSSAIIGSGMAFRYGYFKELMAGVTAVGGFDKEIELKMLKAGHTIAYLHDAIVYDEKIQTSDAFGKQRRRWLAAQLHYFRTDFLSATAALVTKGNADYFDKALQFIQPPRILLLAAVMLCGTACISVNLLMGSSMLWPVLWLVLMVACLLALALAVPLSMYNRKMLVAIGGIPKGMLLMLRSLVSVKGANKTFLHTTHHAGTADIN
jgi:cellulose synthase/poly-beta-1,6-N-acetylglucosamine synthase-like glycosyltransferase